MKDAIDVYQRFRRWPGYADFVYSLAVVAIWRVVIEVYAIFALNRFPLTDTITHKFYFLTIWYNYDGHHYVSIAQKGYEYVQWAFFPLFPLAIKIVSWPAVMLVGNKLSIFIVAGLIISTFSLAGAVFFMLRLSRLVFDIEAGKRAIFLLLFFPTAIFLGAIYTESFFLLFITGSFYFSAKHNWIWASIFAAAAAATRLVGSVMLLCLLIDFWVTYKNNWRDHWREALWFLLIPGSFMAYLIYQWIMIGNPLQFLESEKAWGRLVGWNSVRGVTRDILYGLNLLNFNARMIAPMYDALGILFGVGMAAVLALKRMWSWAIYVFCVTIISLASGTTVGGLRYVIVAFPAFLLLGRWGKRQIFYSFVLAFFAIFFALLSIHYLNTWWLD